MERRGHGVVMDADREPNTEICPEAVGQVITGATPIDIGKGEMVPLGALLACRRKRCRHCEDGWVHRPQPDGSRRASVCGCCAEGWRAARAREAAAAGPTSPAIGVAALADLERARLRAERLARDLAALEADRAERVRRFDEDNADLTASARSAAASAQDEFALGRSAEDRVAVLAMMVEAATKQLAELQAKRAGAESTLQAHREARALAMAMQGDAEREIERRRGGLNLERLDREIAKARRRLVGARIYGGVADAAPEAQP